MPVQFRSVPLNPALSGSAFTPRQIDYGQVIGGWANTPNMAYQALMGSGLSSEEAIRAYSQWRQTGTGPQIQYRPNQQQGQPGWMQSPHQIVPQTSMPSGGQSGTSAYPSAGIGPFAQGTFSPQPNRPFGMTPFYLDPGADTQSGSRPNIQPPSIRIPQIPPQMTGMQLGGGSFGASLVPGSPQYQAQMQRNAAEVAQRQAIANEARRYSQSPSRIDPRNMAVSAYTTPGTPEYAAEQARHAAANAVGRPALDATSRATSPALNLPPGGVFGAGVRIPQMQPRPMQSQQPIYTTGFGGGQYRSGQRNPYLGR